MDTKKVLVVDDNELVRKIVQDYLNRLGHEVQLCSGPFGVLNKVREFVPDVILMDLNMPGLSGQKLVELVRNARNNIGCRLVIFSSEDESIQAKLVQDGHADAYFIKRHSLNGLDKKLEEVCNSREESFV